MAAAIPSGVPKGPSGVTRLRSLMSAPSGRWKAAVIGVSMAPGLMLLTRSAGAGVLDGQGPGEGEHPALGGGVGRGPGLALVGGGRGQVDDVPAAGQQVGEGLAADQEGAGEVDGDQPVPLVERLLVGVGEREHPGHVDHHVERAQPVDGRGHQFLDAGLGAHVADQGGHRPG